MFRNVNNIVVTGGHFTNIDNVGTHDAVSTTLCQNVAEGAIFDSAERYAVGKCHPGTREKVIKQITNWINDPDPTQRILWIHGPAGAGKSAIMQTICELLKQTHPERYGGSFFFAKGHADRGKGLKLFTTLSYQLALQFPSMRAEVNKALYHDPTLPTKSMVVQLLSLIIQPLLQGHSEFPLHSPTLIIDGLDECTEDERVDTQSQIIALISQSIVEYSIPLRFIVASRPEYWIRDAFENSPLLSITLPLSLRDDFDASRDIRDYLIDEFEKIRLANNRIMGSVVPPWPPTNIVNRFVEEASGQYIYASTVLKFVGSFSRFSNPQEQLRIITSPGPHQASAFSELDRLYATILSAYPRWETMKRVLGGILVDANTTIIKVVLGVEPDELVLVFDALSSLIQVTKPRELTQNHFLLESIYGSISAGRDQISYCHLSFRQFLENVNRSGPFHIDIDGFRNEIIRAYFGMIHSNLDQNYSIEPHLSLNLDITTYNCTMLRVVKVCIRQCGVGTVLPYIISMTQRLLLLDGDTWMNYWPCFIQELRSMVAIVDPNSDTTIFYSSPRWRLRRQPSDHQDPEFPVDEFRTAYHKLKDAAILAQDKIIRGLLYCTEFKVTPALVYLAKFCPFSHIYLHEFSRIPGTTDLISTMKQLRHILRLAESYSEPMAPLERLMLNACFNDNEDTSPNTHNHDDWRNQEIWLALQSLKAMFNDHTAGSPEHKYGCWTIPADYYFVSRSISDIRNKEYFQNASNVSILSLIVNPSTWNGRLPLKSHLFRVPSHCLNTSVIAAILCWLNRQLTCSNALKLLEDHEEGLPRRMTATMKYLFEYGFLTAFKESYDKNIILSVSTPYQRRSITITVLPLPQGFHQEDAEHDSCYEFTAEYEYWRTFHDSVFGKMNRQIDSEGSVNPIIDPSLWHPYFAHRCLNALVQFLYGRSHPELPNRYEHVEHWLVYIPECLPYAHTTQENLDALRAVVYLLPEVRTPWYPPTGFWSSVLEFLRDTKPPSYLPKNLIFSSCG